MLSCCHASSFARDYQRFRLGEVDVLVLEHIYNPILVSKYHNFRLILCTLRVILPCSCFWVVSWLLKAFIKTIAMRSRLRYCYQGLDAHIRAFAHFSGIPKSQAILS